MTYKEFILSKQKEIRPNTIHYESLNPKLKPFQRFIVDNALKIGKYCIFADCGLGKTFMQLEWACKVANYTGRRVLILAPLAVVDQTKREAVKFGVDLSMIDVINYEQLNNVDCSVYLGVVLDESSILKNFNGKYRNLIIESFAHLDYKLCCTATPSPNDPMELGNHSEFLGIKKRLEVLAEYFVHDGGDTSKWRLKGHAVDLFYKWVSKWAVMISKPSDIGFNDAGYDLMPIEYIEHQITTEDRCNGLLFNDVAVSATNFNQELRMTRNDRMERAASIANSDSNQYIIWVKHNEEGDMLANMITGSRQVKGSDNPDKKKANLLGFADGEFRVLITKAKIAQFGLNYQNCHNQVFASLDFSFEGLYQAVRRSYRFGQDKAVNIHLITTDTMINVSSTIKRKQHQFEEMQRLMIKNQSYVSN